jgi:hypothetical protein
MTLIDFGLFQRIREKECLDQAWNKRKQVRVHLDHSDYNRR